MTLFLISHRLTAAAVLCGAAVSVSAAKVVINEVRSAPADLAFVELHNAGTAVVDVTGWSLAGRLRCTIPEGSWMEAGEYVVLAGDPGFLRGRVPEGTRVLACEQGPAGEPLRLFQGPPLAGTLVDEVTAEALPWVAAAPLELLHPRLDGARARSWRPSTEENGTPGAANSRFTDEPIVIEEVPPRGGSSAGLTAISLTFSDVVEGLQASALTVNGVPALGVTGSGTGPYVFSLHPSASATLRIVLEAEGVTGDIWEYLDPPTAVLSMPGDVHAGPGATVQVPISVTPGDGIFGIDMTLTYAPAVLQAQSVVVSGIAAVQGFALAANLGMPGTIVISEYAGQNGLVGSGEIARIQFLILGPPGATSDLNWTAASINENGIPVAFASGRVTVTCSGAADGTACDDTDPCTTGDHCQGGACTGGVVLQVPGEVADLRFDADGATLRWTFASGGPGTVHDVLRGFVAQLPVGMGAGDTCLASGVAADFTTDAAAPATAYWYLVRGRNACGTGTYGFATEAGGIPAAERTSSECP